MVDDEFDQGEELLVVKNEEEQYSLWPKYKDIPLGWTSTGFSGSRQDCLTNIESVWTDMRPLSLRRNSEK